MPAKETKAQHELKMQGAKEFTRHFVALIKDGTDLTVRLDVNRKAKEVGAEISVSGKPGSGLEQSFKSLGGAESLFGAMVRTDSAMNFILHGALSQSLRKALGPVIDEAIRGGLDKEKNATRREHGQKLLKVLLPTLKSGEFDVAVSMRGPSESKHYTLLAGLKVKDGADLQSVMRELTRDLPPEARHVIVLDAESAGEIKIHRLDLQSAYDAEVRKAFGEHPFYVAMRSDALLVAGGENGLTAMKEALAARPSVAPPLEVDVSLVRLVPLMGKKGGNDPAALAAKAFGDGKENDKVHFSVEGGKRLTIHLKLDAAAMKFFGLMGKN